MRPLPWKALAAVACGLAIGLGLWFLRTGYTGSDPTSCRSCHTMEASFSTWRSSAHHQQPCGECHLSQAPFAGSWQQAVDGFQHATVFALRREGTYHRLARPAVVEANCRRCHPGLRPMHPTSSRPCLDCHGGTAHGQPALARR